MEGYSSLQREEIQQFYEKKLIYMEKSKEIIQAIPWEQIQLFCEKVSVLRRRQL